MSKYLARLKTLNSEKRADSDPTKPTKDPFVSSVSGHSGRFPETDPFVSSVSEHSSHFPETTLAQDNPFVSFVSEHSTHFPENARFRYWQIAVKPTGEYAREYFMTLNGPPLTQQEMMKRQTRYREDEILWVKGNETDHQRVTCAECRHFQPDTTGDGSGIGDCRIDAPLGKGYRYALNPEPPRFPNSLRFCAGHEPV